MATYHDGVSDFLRQVDEDFIQLLVIAEKRLILLHCEAILANELEARGLVPNLVDCGP